MKKQLKTHKLIILVAALLPLLPSLAHGQTPITIKVATTDETNIIRRDISRITFGAGIRADRPEMGWAMKPLVSQSPDENQKLALTADTFKWLQLGSLRFPNGDNSFEYLWTDPSFKVCLPQGSNCSDPNVQKESMRLRSDPAQAWNLWMTPDEIVDYTKGEKLNMERVFQVNTVKAPDGTDAYLGYIYRPGDGRSFVTDFSDTKMWNAARYAAGWVAEDKKNKSNTQFWEIGNEDWSRLSAGDYAKIFSSFQSEMKAANSDIKLIAQGLEENTAPNLFKNTPEEWLNALVTTLKAKNAQNDVYAYAIHDYIEAPYYSEMKSTNPEGRRKKQTEDMFAAVDLNTKDNGPAVGRVKNLLKAQGLNWKLWMTEFNVQQPIPGCVFNPEKPVPCEETLQDVGHGLVLADWVGKLLTQNIERMYINDLGQSEGAGIVDFGKTSDNDGMKEPKVSVPGVIYSMYAKHFGQTMVKNYSEENQPLLPGKTYQKLGIYSSVSSNDQELRIMVVNRDLDNKAVVNLDTQNVPGRRELADGQYCFRQIGAGKKIGDSNVTVYNPNEPKKVLALNKDKVVWSNPEYINQSNKKGIVNKELAPGSVSLFVIPLTVKNSGTAQAAGAVDCGDVVQTHKALEGFELPEMAAAAQAYFATGAKWSFSGTTGSGIQNNGSIWGAATAPEGKQTAFVQGNDAHISQVVTLEPGIYSVSFYAARRAYGGNNANPIQVKINGEVVGPPIAPVGTDFVQYTTSKFPLDSLGQYTIELVSTNGANADSATFIDQVSFNRVPK
jgi:hypothetical protein